MLAQGRVLEPREGRAAIDVIRLQRLDHPVVAGKHDGKDDVHAAFGQRLARHEPVLDRKDVGPAEPDDIEGELVEAEALVALRRAVALDRDDGASL